MECQFALFCLLVAVPLTTGLQCYECTGLKTGDGSDDCVDAVVSNLTLKTCPQATPFCSQNKIIGEKGSDKATHVIRGCYGGTSSTKTDCTDTSGEAKGVDVEIYQCYCNSDKCNGQTKLAPTIVTCFVSLFIVMHATFF